MPRYTGSCHCGAIRYEIEAVIDRVTECNCSVCRRKGILHHRVKPENFRLLTDPSAVATYQFGTRTAKHHFCRVCGIHTFTRPRAAPELYTVNVRTLDDFDRVRDALAIVPFDGQQWEASVATLPPAT